MDTFVQHISPKPTTHCIAVRMNHQNTKVVFPNTLINRLVLTGKFRKNKNEHIATISANNLLLSERK